MTNICRAGENKICPIPELFDQNLSDETRMLHIFQMRQKCVNFYVLLIKFGKNVVKLIFWGTIERVCTLVTHVGTILPLGID